MSSPKRRIETDVNLPTLSKTTEVPAATNLAFVITIGHEVCLTIHINAMMEAEINTNHFYRMYASDSLPPGAYATVRKCPIDYYTDFGMER